MDFLFHCILASPYWLKYNDPEIYYFQKLISYILSGLNVMIPQIYYSHKLICTYLSNVVFQGGPCTLLTTSQRRPSNCGSISILKFLNCNLFRSRSNVEMFCQTFSKIGQEHRSLNMIWVNTWQSYDTLLLGDMFGLTVTHVKQERAVV